MDAVALADVGEHLDSFVDEVFSSLGRRDRVATAGVYTRGLMLNGKRKSIRRILKIHAISIELEAGDPGRAAREGSALELPASIAKTRAGHHWQDVGRAWLLVGKPDRALDALNRARRIAPQQTRLHPAVRETVHGIAAAQRRQTSSLTGFASWLAVTI